MTGCLIFYLTGLLVSGIPHVVWESALDGGATDKGHGAVLCMETQEIIVAGEAGVGGTQDYCVYRLTLDGDSVLAFTYDYDASDDAGYDVAVASEDMLYVSGTFLMVTDPKFLVCGFTPDGTLLWSNPVAKLGANHSPSLFCRHQDSCYMAGWHMSFTSTYPILRLFHADGSSDDFLDGNAPATYALSGVDVDAEGYIYLSSSERAGILLIKREADGTHIWTGEFEEGDASTRGWQCRVGPSSDIFLCGEQYRQGTATDFLLLKWDTAGTIIWPDSIKAYDLGHNEYCRDIKLDEIRDCYLAGWQVRGEEEDVALVKTDSAGRMLWSWVLEQEGDQEIEAIEVDSEGYIYLAGSHHNGTNWDMLVMQVRQPLTISGRILDTVGASMSGVPVKLSGDTTVEVVSDTDGFYSIEVYNGGNYTVSPDLGGWAFTPSSYTYSPLAHRELNQNFSGEYTAIAEPATPVTPATHPTLEVTTSTIHYAIPHDQRGIISIFDASGQLIKKVEVVGIGSLGFPDLASGVYVIRLGAGDSVLAEKVIISR